MTQVPSYAQIKSLVPELKAIFFDMDGTLLNTEPLHSQVFFQMAQDWKVKIPPPPHPDMTGWSDGQVFELVRNWENFPSHLNQETFIQVKNKTLIDMIPRLNTNQVFFHELYLLLEELKSQSLKLGLVTSSEFEITHPLLEKIGIRHFFEFIITRKDVVSPKPHPEAYQKALSHSGFNAHECFVFEDSQVGIESAHHNGLKVGQVLWWSKA